MVSAVSNCKEQCIHYWVCKNREQYEQTIKKDIKLELELPDYVVGLTELSLICKNQIQPKYNNNYPKFCRIKDCSDCVHFGLCIHQEEYSKLCESLKNVIIPFSLGCPLYKVQLKESE